MDQASYIPEFQVVLTRRCAYNCGYCNFPSTASPLLPSLKQFARSLRMAARMGATQITLTAGEGVDRIRDITSAVRFYGFESWADYLAALCKSVLEFKGERVLFPVLDVGRLSYRDFHKVAPFVSQIRLLLESADDSLLQKAAHAQAAHKEFDTRTIALDELGRLHVPIVTGTRIGIGESEDSWLAVAARASAIYRRHRNLCGFVVIPFRPVPYSTMAFSPPIADDTVVRALNVIRKELHPHIPMAVELPGNPEYSMKFVGPACTGLGVVRYGSNERLNVDIPHAVASVREQLADQDIRLQETLPYPAHYLENYYLSDLLQTNVARYRELRISRGTFNDDTASGLRHSSRKVETGHNYNHQTH
jgi:7,8-didemethyl-8-hydroxy-5-deazariboflavin synthase CofG subunit